MFDLISALHREKNKFAWNICKRTRTSRSLRFTRFGEMLFSGKIQDWRYILSIFLDNMTKINL